MPLYRAYLMENGHVLTAIDLTYENDDEAKRQAAGLGNGRDIELWQGDRRITLLRSRRKVLAGAVSDERR
jgi:hypothetical protein